MANDNIKIPSGLSLDDTLTALAYATSLQEKLFQVKNPETQAPVAQEATPEAPEQASEAPTEPEEPEKADNPTEEKIEPQNANKEDLTSMESRIMEELGRIRGEVSEKIKGEIDKVKEDIQKAINE